MGLGFKEGEHWALGFQGVKQGDEGRQRDTFRLQVSL